MHLIKKGKASNNPNLGYLILQGILLPKPLWGVLWTNQYFLKCQTHQQALLCHLFGNPSFVLLSHKTVGGFYCRVSFLFHSCQGSILGMCLWGLASGRDSNDAWEGDRENKHKHRENVPMPWDFGSKYGHDMKDLMFFLLAVRISTFNVFPWLHPESCSLLSYYIIQYIYIYMYQVIQAVTFLSPSWRSLNPWKGQLMIPKRSRRIASYYLYIYINIYYPFRAGSLYLQLSWNENKWEVLQMMFLLSFPSFAV